jgi:hypothetical protein
MKIIAIRTAGYGEPKIVKLPDRAGDVNGAR